MLGECSLSPRASSRGVLGGRPRWLAIALPNTWISGYELNSIIDYSKLYIINETGSEKGTTWPPKSFLSEACHHDWKEHHLSKKIGPSNINLNIQNYTQTLVESLASILLQSDSFFLRSYHVQYTSTMYANIELYDHQHREDWARQSEYRLIQHHIPMQRSIHVTAIRERCFGFYRGFLCSFVIVIAL